MSAASPAQRARENLTGIVSMLVTGIWLAALLAGQGWWLPFMLFGYIVIVPVTAILFGDDEDIAEWVDDESVSETATDSRATGDDSRDALETLRDRYARGELTDEQFERKLERLLETETLEDVEDRLERDEHANRDTGSDSREPEREFR